MSTLSNILDSDHLILPPPLAMQKSYEDVDDEYIPGSIKIDEHGKLYRKYVTYEKFASGILEQTNIWTRYILPAQVAARQLRLFGNNGIIKFSDIKIMKPSQATASNETVIILPDKARLDGLHYFGQIFATATLYDQTGAVLQVRKDHALGKIPVVLGSECCNLYGMTQEQLIEAGEDPHDPLGYCIINGSERMAVSQEKLRQDVFIVTIDKKERYRISMTCSGLTGPSIVSLRIGKYEAIKLSMRMFGKSTKRTLPVFGVMSLLGMRDVDDMVKRVIKFTRPEWHKEVWLRLQMSVFKYQNIPNMVDYIWAKWDLVSSSESGKVVLPSLLRANPKKKKKVLDPNAGNAQATAPTMVNKIEIPYAEKKRVILEEVHKELFPQMMNEPLDRRIDLFCMMIARLAETMAGKRPVDDRDDWAVKRIEMSPRSMEQLFAGLWKKVIDISQLNIDSKEVSTFNEALKMMETHYIADEFTSSFTTSFWGVKPYKGTSFLRENMAEIVKRESLLAMLAQQRKVNTPTNRRMKRSKIRFVSNSQLGYIDPVDSPEGENCGIVKYMTITCHISIHRMESDVRQFVDAFVSQQPNGLLTTKTILNGKFIGWCNGKETEKSLREAKRHLILHKDLCIVYEEKDQILYVYCDAARPTRPLLVVDQDEVLVIEKKNLWKAPFDQLLREGCVEYIDAWEQNHTLVCPQMSGLKERQVALQGANDYVKEIEAQIEKIKRGEKVVRQYVDEKGFDVQSVQTEESLQDIHKTAQKVKIVV